MIGTANETGRVIFEADPGERVMAAISHCGRCIIATDRRIIEWRPDVDQIHILQFRTYNEISPNDERDYVLMLMYGLAERNS